MRNTMAVPTKKVMRVQVYACGTYAQGTRLSCAPVTPKIPQKYRFSTKDFIFIFLLCFIICLLHHLNMLLSIWQHNQGTSFLGPWCCGVSSLVPCAPAQSACSSLCIVFDQFSPPFFDPSYISQIFKFIKFDIRDLFICVWGMTGLIGLVKINFLIVLCYGE